MDGSWHLRRGQTSHVALPANAAEPPDRNGVADVYVHDTQTSTTRRISRSHAGGDADGPSFDPVISGDGRYVAFVSEASNLTRRSARRTAQVYMHDLSTGLNRAYQPHTEWAARKWTQPAPSHRVMDPRIAFNRWCDLHRAGKCHRGQRDINLLWDVFVHDRSTRQTFRASTDEDEGMENSRAPSLDGTGRLLPLITASRRRRGYGLR